NGVPQKVYDGEAIQFIAPPAPTDPIIELSEESSNLGSVLVGESQTHDITITNTGGADLVITDATVAAPFSTTFSGTIAPFGSAVATISFDPTTAGYFNETLTFNIAGTFTGTNTIALTGAAYSSDYVLEDFDGAVFPPTGWSIVDVDGGSAWNPDLSYIDPYSGTVSAEGMGCNNDYLITPLLVLPAGSPFISFWVGQESISYENSFEVMVSTTGTDPADFIQVADFPSTVPPSAGAWTPFTVDLTSYAGQDVHVAFHVYYSESA
ncbi:MAG: hypothetical protein CO167_12795, partial [Candidatus Marinimicrobia bacterium CG_4_9_14_3_um_filter_48_9]